VTISDVGVTRAVAAIRTKAVQQAGGAFLSLPSTLSRLQVDTRFRCR